MSAHRELPHSGGLFKESLFAAVMITDSSLALMATGFTCFAIVRLCASMLAGPWVDRFGASRVFPFVPLPLALGLALLWQQIGAWSIYPFFALAGISQGFAGVVGTALWAERYGPALIGRIKSTVSMLVVIATALSPAIFGWLLTAKIGFAVILPVMILLCLISASMGWIAYALFPATDVVSGRTQYAVLTANATDS